MTATEVAVLGCGPAGLLAAHAVELSGHRPVIYSVEPIAKSVMGGAMYLHQPIPGVTGEDPDGTIRLVKLGKPSGYAKKVYGDEHHRTSWDQWEEGDIPMWNLRLAYDKLWERYHEEIVPLRINAGHVPVLRKNFMLVLSTIPAKVTCSNPYHRFTSTEIFVYHGQSPGPKSQNTMVYNGDDFVPWYRWSVIDNYHCWEFGSRDSAQALPSMNDPSGLGNFRAVFRMGSGIKPLTNNCDCHSADWEGFGSFHRLGRFGRWEKGILTHHAFIEARGLVHALLNL